VIPQVSSFFFDEVRNEVMASSYGRGIWKLYVPNFDYCLFFPGFMRPNIYTDRTRSALTGTCLSFCLSCINLDISNLKLNESVILTPFGGSVIVTKVPTEAISSQGMIAQLNRMNVTGDVSRGQ
jgi:hypothetical protein